METAPISVTYCYHFRDFKGYTSGVQKDKGTQLPLHMQPDRLMLNHLVLKREWTILPILTFDL